MPPTLGELPDLREHHSQSRLFLRCPLAPIAALTLSRRDPLRPHCRGQSKYFTLPSAFSTPRHEC
jgi:hypothetical protein